MGLRPTWMQGVFTGLLATIRCHRHSWQAPMLPFHFHCTGFVGVLFVSGFLKNSFELSVPLTIWSQKGSFCGFKLGDSTLAHVGANSARDWTIVLLAPFFATGSIILSAPLRKAWLQINLHCGFWLDYYRIERTAFLSVHGRLPDVFRNWFISFVEKNTRWNLSKPNPFWRVWFSIDCYGWCLSNSNGAKSWAD